jgi:hypothetical protein
LIDRAAKLMMGYAVFVVIIGVASYVLIGPEAKTALMSGGGVGLICLVLGALIGQGKAWALPASIGALILVCGVFIWRSSVAWMAYAAGQGEKIVPATLISLMLIVALAILPALFKAMKQRDTVVEVGG